VTNELERRGAFDHDFIARHVEGFQPYMERARQVTLADAVRITGVAREQIEALAAWYHELSPAAISVGNGLERNQNGGSAIRVIFALPALTGKLGVPGGGLVNGASQAFPKTPARLARPELAPAGTRLINILDVGAHLLDPSLSPPLQALFIYNHNPVVVHPDQNRLRRGLAREDLFLVGADTVMTDSMACCDLVLPASTHFEYDDLYPAYGQHWLQRAEAVIRPRGESLPNTEIFRRLAARFGFDDPIFTASDAELMDDAMDAADARLAGVSPSRVPTDRALAMTFGGEQAVLFHNVFPKTPSGKVELASRYLEGKYGALLPSFRAYETPYPLLLISPASDRRITSTFGGPSAQRAEPLEMHPVDAESRGLGDGAMVRIWNDLGEIHLRLRVTEVVRPGVVSTFKGTWLRTSDNGQTVSALCPGHHADLSGGACFNDTRVEVAAV
jgi:anaerobic selenocysteine-containing dehydrogenase